MLKWIEATGRSEDAAVQNALAQLGLDRDSVSVEVLERAKSGFLGFGSAKLRSRYNEVRKWYTVGVAADNGYNLNEELTTRMNTAANIITTGSNTLGADNAEVLARVEALCRRVGRSGGGSAADENAPTTLVSGEFVLDENRRVLLKAGRQIELTQVEFQIMELFFHNPGIALVREKILKGVWGENYFGDVKIVDVNIRRLRMKVEDEPSHPTHIMTVWGYGYRWEE